MEKSTLKINNEDRQNFVATRMSLPLFMVSRRMDLFKIPSKHSLINLLFRQSY